MPLPLLSILSVFDSSLYIFLVFLICFQIKPEKQEVSDNVKVVVRCRPLNQREKMMGFKPAVTVDEIRGTITVNKLESAQEPPKTFTFDTVFGPDSKQLDVYNLTARPIVDSVLEGYNGNTFLMIYHSFMVPPQSSRSVVKKTIPVTFKL